MAANNNKFDMKEYMRTTSVGCVKEPQANALHFLQNGDLRSFMDVVNTADVEAHAADPEHWLNQPVDGDLGGRGNLLDLAVQMDKPEFVSVLVSAGARCDMISASSGLAPTHKAAMDGNVHLLRLLMGDGDDVDPNLRSSDRHGGWTPLHFAANSGHLACINFLLELDSVDVDPKDTRGVQTPLFLAVKAKNEAAVRVLLENGANLGAKCGRSTIQEYLADILPEVVPSKIRVKKTRDVMLNLKDKMFELVKSTKRGGNNYPADLASFKTFARFIRTMNEQENLNEVFDLACEKGLDEHVKILLKKGVNPNTGGKPLLEVAFHGFYNVLRVLKADGRINFRMTNDRTKETVLHCVLKKEFKGANPGDYEKCLDILLDGNTEGRKDLFKQMKGVIDSNDVSKQIKSIINKRDDLDNTALHYATQKWPQRTVRKLLEFGANIGIKNYWKEIPISRIRPETMESFLNEFCLSYSGDVVHEDFSLTFHYDFLAPDIEALPEKYRLGAKEMESEELLKGRKAVVQPLPETESLWYMGQSKQHRHLLKHPVITSFLWYKWERIRRTFNRNLRFYLLFVYILTWYIFENIGGEANNRSPSKFGYGLFILLFIAMLGFILRDWIGDIKDYQRSKKMESLYKRSDSSCFLFANLIISNWFEAIFITAMVIIIATQPLDTSETISSSSSLENSTITSSSLDLGEEASSRDSVVLKYTLTGLLAVLAFREFVQMSVSLKRYVCSFENWMELAMIGLIAAMLHNEGGDPDVSRHLGAISIVLSWAELITLIGKHPKLNRCNIYVTMFYKVLKTFFLFLTWYSLFIIAFGLGFYILLHNTNPKEGDYEYFNKPWVSLVKTSSMFVGELEFSDIPINLESTLAPLSYLFFLAFVFLIVVVLMNLLNGLAVSDTGAIQDKAEIYSHLSRVETISHLESVMLGDPFDFLSNVPAMLSSVPSCSVVRQLYRSRALGTFFTKISSTGILLFYNYLPDKSVTINPNKNGQDCYCLSYDEMGRDIIASAKDIVMKREQKAADMSTRDEEKITNLDDQLMDRIGKIELQLAALSKMDVKMDQILVKLNRL